MKRFLVYNFSGEVDEIFHLFPNERLATIAAIIREHGGSATLVDRTNFADLLRFGSAFMQNLGGLSFSESNEPYERVVRQEAAAVADMDCDVIFLNLWHGSGFKFSIDLLRVLKQTDPQIVAYGIGQKVDWFSEHIFELTDGSLDGLITGLGYNAVERIVLEDNPQTIPNMILLRDGEVTNNGKEIIDLDNYPAPEYDKTAYPGIGEKAPVYAINLSNQACPNRCAFCPRPENYGSVVRRRDIARVTAELEELHFRHGGTHYRVWDSTPPRHALTELAESICRSGLSGKITLSAFARVDINSTEDFRLMREAGFLSLFFGVESLDDDNLRKLKKGINYDTCRETIEKAHAAGIRTVASFIFPTPGETRHTMENTLRRIRELKPFLDSVLALPAGVYPPTEWGRFPDKYGIQLKDNYISEFIVYPLKYQVPFRHWDPIPFSYDLMGKKAAQVTFEDILDVHEEFTARVRDDIGVPSIPDNYFLVADLLGREPEEVTRRIVRQIMERDYADMGAMFEEARTREQ